MGQRRLRLRHRRARLLGEHWAAARYSCVGTNPWNERDQLCHRFDNGPPKRRLGPLPGRVVRILRDALRTISDALRRAVEAAVEVAGIYVHGARRARDRAAITTWSSTGSRGLRLLRLGHVSRVHAGVAQP